MSHPAPVKRPRARRPSPILARLAKGWLRQRLALQACVVLALLCWASVLALALAYAHHRQAATLIACSALVAGVALALGAGMLAAPQLALRLLFGSGEAALVGIARALGRLLPAHAGRLRAHAAFTAQPPEDARSRALAAGYCAQVEAGLAQPQVAQALGARPQRQRRLVLGGALAGVLVATALVAARPVVAARLWAALRHEVLVETSHAPLCYDFAVELTYPAYTQRAPWRQSGGTGELQALVGTQARITAQPTHLPSRAWLRFVPRDLSARRAAGGAAAVADMAAGALADLPAEVTADGRVGGSLTLAEPGHYAWLLEYADGRRELDCARHALIPVADRPPEVQLQAPMEDLVVRGDANITLMWRASDDLGLAEQNLVAEDANGQRTVLPLPLHKPRAAPLRLHRGRAVVAAASLPLVPGAALWLHVEASDAQAPPAVGRSQARRVSLFSPQLHHRQVLEKLQVGQDFLVDWLAQEWQLTGPKAAAAATPELPAAPASQAPPSGRPAPLAQAIERARAHFVALDGALKHDALAARNVRSIVHEIRLHTERAGAALAPPAPPQAAERPDAGRRRMLEQDLLYVDSLQHRSRASQVQLDAADVAMTGRALGQRLAASKGPTTAAEQHQRSRELALLLERLKGQVAQLLEQAAASGKAMPRSFANAEAQLGSKWKQTLERIEASLANNDGAAAAEELRHLGEMVDAMVAGLEEAKTEIAPPALAAAQGQLQALAQEAQALTDAQAQLVADIGKWQGAQLQQAVGRSHTEALEEARHRVAAVQAQLQPFVEDGPLAAQLGHEARSLAAAVGDLNTLLAQPQLRLAQQQAALAQARQQELEARLGPAAPLEAQATQEGPLARSVRRSLQAAGKNLARVQELLQALVQENEPPAQDSQLAKALQALGANQQQLQQRGIQATAHMAALRAEVPMLGEAGEALLKEATAAMAAAKDALGAGKAATGGRLAKAAEEKLQAFMEAAAAQAASSKAAGMPMPVGGEPGTEGEAGEAGEEGEGGQSKTNAKPAGEGAGDAAGDGAGRAGAGTKPGKEGPHGPPMPGAGGKPGAGAGEAGEGAAGGSPGGGQQAGAPGSASPDGEGGGGDGQQTGGGGRAGDAEDVDLPSGGRDPAAEAFRRALQDAAKQRPPPRYAPAVDGYYEELLR